jgi:hypothetical protein
MKAYRFFSEPNRTVNDGNTGLILFKFDSAGEYVTLDERLANRMKPHFKCEEIELMEVKGNPEPESEPEKEQEVKVYKCKHCDYTTENKGELLAHYREHKKEA